MHTGTVCFREVGTNPFITVTRALPLCVLDWVSNPLTDCQHYASNIMECGSTPDGIVTSFDVQFFCIYIYVGCNQWSWAHTQLYLLHLHSYMVPLAHCGGHCGHLQSDKVWEWTFCGERMCTCLLCVWTLTLCRSVYAYMYNIQLLTIVITYLIDSCIASFQERFRGRRFTQLVC